MSKNAAGDPPQFLNGGFTRPFDGNVSGSVGPYTTPYKNPYMGDPPGTASTGSSASSIEDLKIILEKIKPTMAQQVGVFYKEVSELVPQGLAEALTLRYMESLVK